MRKHIRFTALLLAVCILLNNAAFPAAAEGSLDSSQETTVPTEVATVSTEETSAPTEETSAPTEETSAPTEETSTPTEESSAPTEVTSAPTEPSLPQPIATGTVTCDTSVNIRSGPGTGYEVLDFAYDGQQVSIYEIVTTEEGDWGRIGEGRWICLTYVLLDGQEPTEETTAPAEETTDPTEESTDPTEESTDPTEETSDPTEETTDPTEESTAPTEETSDPTEESTDPTEETTDPLTELHAQLAAISVGIQYAEIVPQKMSLTWWAMNCGKMQVDLSLVAENMLAASPEGVVLSEDAIPQELLYQPENNILFLSSPKDLVYLSYVDPAEYQRMTLRFLPSQQENRGFYLIDPMDELQFSPLGSLEAPFRGKLIFQELTGPIQLDCPLFDALTDEVKIEDLILECRAEEPMEGGLLAKWVVHTYGGAEWDITLSAPEMEEDAVAILPPLVGSLGSECDVALELANSSGLRVIGSGFLCTQIGTNAKFTVSGLSALPSVTGYAGNVGGLVGTMSSGAELTVLGDCLAVSSVTGSTNVGGLIGSAFDPVLSLPMVTGVESALVTGENAGGVIGSLTYSAGDHALSLSAGNLQINGRTNTGGLVGLLSNENGLLELTASAEGICFGSDALGCTGSLIGSYLAPQMVESLVFNGEAVADEASLVDLIGNVSPDEEPTDPTEESTDPTEETTDPTEETTDPAAQLAAEIEAILSADVIPQEMSLTWWAICCGKMDIAVSLTSEGEENTDTTALPPELNYTPAEGILQITSAQDLILLSYVDPQAYCNLTLDFIPTEEEATGFDLRSQPDRLEFLSLGSLDAPFAGKVCFAEWAGPVLLEKPLFAALSDDAQLIQVSLECHAKKAIEGGLLAKYVVHNVGGNTWQITLEHPEMEEGATAFLPALLGSVAVQSNVSLELTDRSGLQVLGSGFLCDVLGEAATLNVSGLSLIPTVTGYSENIGGLIGQMNAGSSLHVSGESLTLSQVIGSQNAGGVIGAAEDAILSLPPIVGTEGATIRGQNVGALAGSLTLSAGEHAITQNASNLTLDGSANAGGLFGILCLKDATLSLTTTLDGLSFGESALGNNGSIFGTFQAPTLENALILNGEPVIDRTGFKALAGSTQSEDPIVTVEEVQEMMDEIANAELIPGEMSLAWWAVVCEKVTAEEIAAEINGTSLPSDETEPTQESVPAEEETEPTTATEATMQTEASEETTLPQDSPSGGASDTTEEDILDQEDVLLTEYAPMAASFSLNRSASLRTLSLSEEDEASPLSLEEGAAISTFSLNGENFQDEGTPVLLAQAEGESEEDTPAGGIALLGDDVEIPIEVIQKPIEITKAPDLIRLSYVNPKDYQTENIRIFLNDASPSSIIDVTSAQSVSTTNGNTATLEFRGLGNEAAPYQGALDSELFVKLKRPLFNALSDSATVNAKLYVDPDVKSSTGLGILAENGKKRTSGNSSSWTVELRAVTENKTGTDLAYSLPLLGTMEAESSVNVNLTLSVGSLNDFNFAPLATYSALTILGGGCLCGTMEAGTAESKTTLTVTGLTAIPAVNNTSGNAGSLVGTMGSNTQITVTLPEGTTALPISNVTASENAGGLVGSMSASASLSIGEGNKISTTGVTITGNNAGGLVGWMEGATTLTADWSSFIVPTVKGTEYAGGLAGYAKNPGTTFQNIPATGPVTGPATISGKIAGGLVGWLQNSGNNSFELNKSISNVTLSGTDSSGGLIGELHNDHGSNADPISYTISRGNNLTAGNEFSSVTLTGGNAGGLIGKYYTDDLENTLTIKDISVTSSSSAASYGGVIGKVDGIAAYVEFSGVTTTTNGNTTNRGGLIGELSEYGHMVKVGTGVNVSGSFLGTNVGGLIGAMPHGVLYIAKATEGDSSFPELELTSITSNASANRGWILGKRGNTLVYTDIPDWNAEKGSETNDTGVWGQVLRVDGVLNTLLTLNEPAHTVTVKAPSLQDENATTLANNAIIEDIVDFAAVALRLQLNARDALQFENEDFDKNSTVAITLSDNPTVSIDLSGTGLTGLTQDVKSTDVFNLDIIGNSGTITLPNLKVYASGNAHDRQGLIGKAGELTVSGLTVDGHIATHVLNGDIYAGAMLAEAAGTTSLTSVTSSIQMTISGGNSNNCAYSGIVAATGSACTNITFDDCELKTGSIISDGTSKNSYVAGFLALGNYNNGNVQTQITVRNTCSVGGEIKKAGTPNDYTRIGGLIATLYNGSYTLDISSLTVSGLTVSAPTDFAKTCGGLLGYEWMNTTATISGVTIKSCTLNAEKSMFGGLVYKGSGYWKVGTEDGSTGISISGSSVNGYSDSGAPSGLLVCRANVENTEKGALYLEILHNGYTISSVEVSLTGNSGEYFDELVGTTKGKLGNGIVSIATAATSTPETPALITGETYTKQLGTNYSNKFTRYYYNLNFFRSLGALNADGSINWDIATVDSAEEMVLWSAWDYCDSSIQKYFIKSGVAPSTIQCEDLDLTGYSYYPVSIHSRSVTVGSSESGPTITFDFAGLETAEAGNKQPSNERSQHYGMHTGLFTDVENRSDSPKTLTVQNVTLKGTVGNSAVINGTADGSTSANLKLKFTNIHLNGICISPVPDTTPLLIQSIGSYSELDMSGVKTTGGYENGTYAASSLIGTVGSSSGTHIQLKFSNMVLDGSTTARAQKSDIYQTYHTIFKQALFLLAFDYTDGNTCSGVYNFNKDESHQYTLGRELSNNDGGPVSGRNNGLQYWFYDGIGEDDNYLVCLAEQEGSSPETFFAEGYRPYVATKEKAENTAYHHELDINLRKPKVIQGCGTYSDPYIIKDALQLKAIAELLNSADGTVDGMQLVLNVGNAGVIKPGETVTFGPQNGHTAGSVSLIPAETTPPETTGETGTTGSDTGETGGTNTPGNGDCQDVVFTCNDGNWTSNHAEASTLDGETVRTYVRNAYYKLEGNIELPSDWSGLGGFEPKKAFSGVIFGNGNTITLDSQGTFKQFGGLIKYSLGSVVKNLSIVYKNSITIQCDEVPTGVDANFFGGVVGWCMGGDTIIDEVTVTYKNALGVSGTYPYLAAVGGYVGLVGGTELGETQGYGGGVVFRKITSSGLTVPTGKDDHYYFNPYVGRVLDGYALSEGGKLDNTDKNYQIPGISNIYYHLEITDSQVTVNDADGLWLLSAIANSGAGNSGSCKAYTVGKARTGQYNNLGFSPADLTDEASETTVHLGGISGNKKATSYLTNSLPDFSSLTNGTAVSIVLKADVEFNMISYGNGFRGIGTSYGNNATTTGNYRLIKVSSLNGNNCTVTLAQERKEYYEEQSSWTTMGAGLFTTLLASDSLTVKDLVLSGYTGITYTTKNKTSRTVNLLNDSNRLGRTGAGMLAGSIVKNSYGTISLQNVCLNGAEATPVKVTGEASFAGGLIGLIWGKNDGAIALRNCTCKFLDVSGYITVGGFLGYVQANSIDITYTEDSPALTDVRIKSTVANDGTRSGVGGLLGYTNNCAVSITSNSGSLSISNLDVYNSNQGGGGDTAHTGGLAGLWACNRNNFSFSICNINLTGTITIQGQNNSNSNTGGLVGAVIDEYGNWNSSTPKTISLTVSNVHLASDPGSTMTIQKARQIGGLFGFVKIGSTLDICNVSIGNTGNPVIIASNPSSGTLMNGNAGLIGAKCMTSQINLTNVTLTNTNILSHNTQMTALVVGRIADGDSDTIRYVDMENVEFNNCSVVVDDSAYYVGLLYGAVRNSNKQVFRGHNILVRNCTLGLYLKGNSLGSLKGVTTVPDASSIGLKTASGSYVSYPISGNKVTMESYCGSDYMGIWGGYVENGFATVQLVGVSIQQNSDTLPAKEYGSSTTDSYIIRADYTGTASGASGVTSSPWRTLAGVPSFTGDGTAFVTNSTQSVAAKILADYTGEAPKANIQYAKADAATTFFSDSKNAYCFSTYDDAGENEKLSGKEGLKNFPVLLINSNDYNKADTIVKLYISLLTNTAIGDMHISSITQTVYSRQGDSFVTNAEGVIPSLDVNGQTIVAYKDKFDNQKNQFTLLDVQYADPADNTKTAYHLYIPVIVKKVLEFKFWAAADNGTTYSTESYGRLNSAAIGANTDKITALLTFQYQRDAAEWQAAVNNGENLLWNFDKKVVLDIVNGQSLPAGTRLTLVDRNDGDKAYYWTHDGSREFLFSKFASVSDDTKMWSWKNVCLCDLLTLSTKDYSDGDPNKYVETTNLEDAKLKSGTKYYRPANDGDTEGLVCITVSLKDEYVQNGYVQETYYLTMQTPKGNTAVSNFYIMSPPNLEIPKDAQGNPVAVLPTTRLPAGSSKGPCALNLAENQVFIGDLFTQGIEVSTAADSNVEISLDNKIITATVTSTIHFKDKPTLDSFNGFSSTDTIYQSIRIYLKEIVGDNATAVTFADGTTISIDDGDDIPLDSSYFDYPIPQTIITNKEKEGFSSRNWSTDDYNRPTYTSSFTFTLTYSEDGILNQFPVQNVLQNNGIQIFAESALTLLNPEPNTGTLDRSNLRVQGNDSNKFCRKDVSLAKLYYNVDYSKVDYSLSPNNAPGINGRVESTISIPTVAVYDCSEVAGASSAEKLKLSATLFRKGEDNNYTIPVTCSDCLSISRISPQMLGNGNITKDDGAFSSFTLSDFDGQSRIQISFNLDVASGAAFQGHNHTYANYKVVLNAELVDMLEDGSEHVIEGSSASDFIIYTNAKIRTDLIS